MKLGSLSITNHTSFPEDEFDLECDGLTPRLHAHHGGWLASIANGLAHSSHCLVAKRLNAIVGILPLLLVKGPIFGKFLVSLPYINTGGVWAQDHDAAAALIERACDLADELDVRYLELRHEVPVTHPKLNFERTDKVHMRLALPLSDELLDKSFKSKLRSQIKKAGEYPSSVHWGSLDLLNDFYHVFAINMRDLGTPVFSKHLFRSILSAFGEQAELCVVRHDGRPVAGALLVHLDGVTEVPSASSLRAANPTGVNMWMYRQLLKRAVERGSHTFDFGRSSQGSGTYKFKEQWGAKPFPAVWQYYVRKGSVEAMRPDSSGNQRLIRIWQRLRFGLPVSLARPSFGESLNRFFILNEFNLR